MPDLSDPIYEFLRGDHVFLMDLYEDRVDPRLPWTLAGVGERERLADALRQLADVFATRPDLPIPKEGYVRLDVIADGERRVAEIEHGPAGYRFQVLPGVYEPADTAAKVAAADTPAIKRPPPGLTQPTRLERGKLSAATSRRRTQ